VEERFHCFFRDDAGDDGGACQSVTWIATVSEKSVCLIFALATELLEVIRIFHRLRPHRRSVHLLPNRCRNSLRETVRNLMEHGISGLIVKPMAIRCTHGGKLTRSCC
jgi:hypothetical protein